MRRLKLILISIISLCLIGVFTYFIITINGSVDTIMDTYESVNGNTLTGSGTKKYVFLKTYTKMTGDTELAFALGYNEHDAVVDGIVDSDINSDEDDYDSPDLCNCTESCILEQRCTKDDCPVCSEDWTKCTFTPECTCTEKCTEDNVDSDCPACQLDINNCKGHSDSLVYALIFNDGLGANIVSQYLTNFSYVAQSSGSTLEDEGCGYFALWIAAYNLGLYSGHFEDALLEAYPDKLEVNNYGYVDGTISSVGIGFVETGNNTKLKDYNMSFVNTLNLTLGRSGYYSVGKKLSNMNDLKSGSWIIHYTYHGATDQGGHWTYYNGNPHSDRECQCVIQGDIVPDDFMVDAYFEVK